MYDEMSINTASGDMNPVSKNILEEFDAVDTCSAIKQAKSLVRELINRHCPETKPGQYETKHFTGLESELRVAKPVWRTSIKPGNKSWEHELKLEMREVTL